MQNEWRNKTPFLISNMQKNGIDQNTENEIKLKIATGAYLVDIITPAWSTDFSEREKKKYEKVFIIIYYIQWTGVVLIQTLNFKLKSKPTEKSVQ